MSDDRNIQFPPRLRVPTAAQYIGVSERSVASPNWRKRHGIPFFRVGRAIVFDRAALDRWLAKHAERRVRA